MCDAAVRITGRHDLTTVLQEVVDSSRDAIGAEYAALGVLNAERSGLSDFVYAGISPHERERIGDLPRGKGLLGTLIRDPRPLRIPSIQQHPDSYGFPDNHPVMITFLGVPILGRHGPIGNLYFTEKRGGGAFTDEDEALAIMLASHAAVAVENARMTEERERLVADLRSSHAARDRFFAMINHELRNAITAVFGWSELWLRKVADDPPRAALEVYESSERAVALLDDLLDLSKMDAAQFDLAVKDVDLSYVVREAVATQEPAADQRGIALEVTGTDQPIPCRTDPVRVMQIIVNLVKNAVRHSPERAVVRAEVTTNQEEMRVAIVDQGPGIPQEHLASIFEAYDRAGQDDRRGTGLGLTLSRALARRMGGELSVSSEPGRGARFELRLPRSLDAVFKKSS